MIDVSPTMPPVRYPQRSTPALRARYAGVWPGRTILDFVNDYADRKAGMPGFDITGWVGVGAPAGLQKNGLERLHGDILKSLNSPDLKDKLVAQGYELSPLSPTAFTEIVRRDVVTWGKVVRESGAKVD